MPDSFTSYLAELDGGANPYDVARKIASHLRSSSNPALAEYATIFENMESSYPIPEQAKGAIKNYVELLRKNVIGGRRRRRVTRRRKTARKTRRHRKTRRA